MPWQNLSISAISQQLVPRFWPNFKVRFLAPSITDANWHGNICSINICPGNNYPYQHNLSCYSPDFDQTFWTQYFGGLNFFGPNFARPKYFQTQNFCQTWKDLYQVLLKTTRTTTTTTLMGCDTIEINLVFNFVVCNIMILSHFFTFLWNSWWSSVVFAIFCKAPPLKNNSAY